MKNFFKAKITSRERKITSRNYSPYSNIGIIYKDCIFYAYAGPGATKNGKEEHDPLHCHVYFVGKKRKNLKIDCEKVEELNGKKIPEDLEKYFRRNRLKIKRKTLEVFLNGKCN